MSVTTLNKPAGVWCAHCRPGRERCTIYPTRPEECRRFVCLYLIEARLSEAWKPSHCRIVLTTDLGGDRIIASVDPQRPDAWRVSPYYEQLKRWAEVSARFRGQVMVRVGRRAYMIFPDRDVDLGEVGTDETIIITERETPLGIELEPLKVSKNDPRALKLAQQSATVLAPNSGERPL
jgi:hypothetical protein